MKMNDKILAMILAEHVQAYHNTDPSMVFNQITCDVVYSSIGYSIFMPGEDYKPFTGILVNGNLRMHVVNGLLHRSDGPAKTWAANKTNKYRTIHEYYVNDVYMSFQEFKDLYLVTHLREYQE